MHNENLEDWFNGDIDDDDLSIDDIRELEILVDEAVYRKIFSMDSDYIFTTHTGMQ